MTHRQACTRPDEVETDKLPKYTKNGNLNELHPLVWGHLTHSSPCPIET